VIEPAGNRHHLDTARATVYGRGDTEDRVKREALAFFRILPAGAADVGDEVSREDLRAAGAGDWSLRDLGGDDLTDVLPPLGPEYDEPIRMDDRPPADGERVVTLALGKAG